MYSFKDNLFLNYNKSIYLLSDLHLLPFSSLFCPNYISLLILWYSSQIVLPHHSLSFRFLQHVHPYCLFRILHPVRVLVSEVYTALPLFSFLIFSLVKQECTILSFNSAYRSSHFGRGSTLLECTTSDYWVVMALKTLVIKQLPSFFLFKFECSFYHTPCI